MRFILIISLLCLIIAVKHSQVNTNEYLVNQCSIDMTFNKDLICD